MSASLLQRKQGGRTISGQKSKVECLKNRKMWFLHIILTSPFFKRRFFQSLNNDKSILVRKGRGDNPLSVTLKYIGFFLATYFIIFKAFNSTLFFLNCRDPYSGCIIGCNECGSAFLGFRWGRLKLTRLKQQNRTERIVVFF